MTHAELKRSILIRYGSDARLRLWNSPCGVYFTDTGIPVKVGIKGAADILGIRKSDGRLLGIEVKVGPDKLRPEQRQWADVMRSYGAVVIEAREVSDCESLFT